MISRRQILKDLGIVPGMICAHNLFGQTAVPQVESFDQLIYPPLAALDRPEPFGYRPATEEQKRIAKQMIDGTPKGPRPIDIAQSFVDRFYAISPSLISQWPAPDSWNPLIVDFFQSTSIRAENDMIAWCAAFANWSLERSGRNGSRSASSQSFLSKEFKKTDSPSPGDLAVFTCYDSSSGKSLGLGHVTFFKQQLSDDTIRVIGGNQSGDGHSSIIRESAFPTDARSVRRHVDDKYIACTMKLNTYIRVV
jgi:uncharacterized protein (TIGR02594 family)